MLWNSLRGWIRQSLGIVPTLDLHGCGVREAVAETEAFLHKAQAQGDVEVRIIYGKGNGSPGGRGVLREVIPRWLDDAVDLVASYQRLPDASGGDGSVRVRLRAPNQDTIPS